jgi:hypothetical protein
MKYFALLSIFLFSSCVTNKVSVISGQVFKTEKTVRLVNKPDTTYYIRLYNGDIITEKEFDKRWEKSLKETNKEIKRRIKN